MLETAVSLQQTGEAVYTAPKATSLPRRFLISPSVDFWCFGGASLVVAFFILVFQSLSTATQSPVNTRLSQIAATFSLLSLVCNYPHFMVSYKIAYGRGTKFVLRNWYALIFVPIALAMLFLIAYVGYAIPVSREWDAISMLYQGIQALGIRVTRGTHPVGGEVLSFMLWLMWLTVGWHYAKQVFGVTMMQARFDGFQITSGQRLWLKAAVFAIAFESLIGSLAGNRHGVGDFYGFVATSFRVPGWVGRSVIVGLYVILVLAIFNIFYKRWRQTGEKPSKNMIVAPLAFLVWWSPPFRHLTYFYVVVPFFHCLQYLPFAYVYEKGRATERNFGEFRFTAAILAVLVAGFAFFEFVPNQLDTRLNTTAWQITNFFVIGFNIFINVHHYFIDSVIWKFNDPEVRQHLLGGVRA